MMVDALEVRLDVFRAIPPYFKKPQSSVPVLFTARDAAEGGGSKLGVAERRALLEAALPFASGIDVELRNVAKYRSLLKGAAVNGVIKVVSFHDFITTPKLEQLLELKERAVEAGASIFKVATQVRSAGDLAILLEFLERSKQLPVAVMGMGPLGRASRLALAAAGSCLNYGWLDRPQVPGQFSAMILKQRVKEVLSQEQGN